MESYADGADWTALFPGEEAPDEDLLAAASRQIDRLTFGRIRAMGGPEALSEYQRALLGEAACRLARFRRDNGTLWGWTAASYTIGDVSVKAAQGAGVRYLGGEPVPGEVTALLEQAGLADRLARGTL